MLEAPTWLRPKQLPVGGRWAQPTHRTATITEGCFESPSLGRWVTQQQITETPLDWRAIGSPANAAFLFPEDGGPSLCAPEKDIGLPAPGPAARSLVPMSKPTDQSAGSRGRSCGVGKRGNLRREVWAEGV